MRKMKQILILLSLTVLWGLRAGAQNGFPSFALDEVPFFRLDIQTTGAQSSADYQKAIDTAILKAVSEIPDPFVRSQLVAVENFFLSKQQPIDSFQSITQLIKGSVSKGSAWGAAGFEGEKWIEGFTLFIKEDLLSMPLYFRSTLLHESLGHLAQYLALYSKHGPTGTLDWMTLQGSHRTDFQKVTHTAAAVMEMQIYRSIPKQIMMDEVQNSLLSDKMKAAFVNFFNDNYALSSRDLVKKRARGESCRPPAPSDCITDADFEVIFARLRNLGFQEL